MNENCFETKKARLSILCSFCLCMMDEPVRLCVPVWAHLLPNPLFVTGESRERERERERERAMERGRVMEAGYGRGRRGEETVRGKQEGGVRNTVGSILFSYFLQRTRGDPKTREWVFHVRRQGDCKQASKEQHLNSQDWACWRILLRSRTAAAHKERTTSSSCGWTSEMP